MMRLRRPAATPPTLRDTGKGGITAAEHVRKRAMAPGAELRFPGHWNEPDVRGALHAMQGIACAYCQRQLDDERGQVDHFRPKGGGKEAGGSNYWWLAYSFDNCFLSCGTCNSSSCKWDRFPLATSARPIEYGERGRLHEENRLFVHPVDDPLDEWIRVAWRDDEHDEEGFVMPRDCLAKGTCERLRVDTSIDTFRLNKSIMLVRDRVQIVRAVHRAMKSGDREKVHRLACRYLPHGAAAYSFLREADASWLPTPREEFLVWLHHLRDRLRRIAESLRRFPNDPPNMRMLDEILWAFAVAWKDPVPNTSSSGEIATWLGDHVGPLRDAIESRLQRL